MKHIGNISPSKGSNKAPKRIGRGAGSGHGGTSTRGHKGHSSRSGFKQKASFEGGQMPLSRRLPKYGFTNPFRIEYQEVNVARLQEMVDTNLIQNGDSVNLEVLRKFGVIKSSRIPVKVLGNGDLTAKLTISAAKFTESAKAKIEQAGGTAVIDE
jgi:large subunit ribosomal protein L15